MPNRGYRSATAPKGKSKSSHVKSKSRSSQRSQNAYKVDADQVESEDELTVKPEDDEEIDSDEAFESGDEDKFDSFAFSGSQYLKKHGYKPTAAVSKKKKAAPRYLEVDLNESSDSNGAELQASEEGVASQSESDAPSDFEGDTGDDLVDLSALLGPADHIPSSATSSDEESSSVSGESSDDSSRSEADEDDQDSDLDEGSQVGKDDALERFVQGIEQKRKRQEDVPAKVHEREKKRKIADINEQAPESEYNLGLSSSHRKLDLTTMIESLGNGDGKALKRTQTLEAPLAKPIQDRMNRSAAYDTVKEQVTKWQPAVRQMREAAVLKFPLNDPAKVQPNNNSISASFKPSNALETQIQDILKESGMQSEKAIAKFEDLEMAKLTVEEVQKRRADLAIMRDLLFRQEQKAKRQSKIKSKAYRRVHRKEKEKAKLAMLADMPQAEAAHESEARRARERMELRHKNTGKWAQKMLSRADHGEGSRAAITEQLQRGEELERKIRGIDTEGNSDSAESEEDHIPEDADADAPLPDKGVFSMKFMRDADAKQAAEVLEHEDTFANTDKSELEIDAGIIDNNQGRRAFKPSTSDPARSKRKSPASTDGKSSVLPGRSVELKEIRQVPSQNVGSDANPWLDNAGPSRRKQETIIDRDTDESLKFAAKLSKKKKEVPMHQGRIKAPVLDVNRVLPIKTVSKKLTETSDNEDRPSESDQIAFRQTDLIRQAFAGDDVVAQFAEEKESDAIRDAPQEVDETLPGWGSWVGDGVKKSRPLKKFIKHIAGIKTEHRKDAKLEHVIINEKRMKQAKSYMSQAVPFPYENKEQYERSISLPIGPEFTTRTNFQKQIMPHIVKKQGKVVAPMERPFKE